MISMFNRGNPILDLTFKVGSAVTTYLDGASRAGLNPYRMVILDSSDANGVGTAQFASIKYPNTSFTNGEKILGVAMGPENTGANVGRVGSFAGDPYYPIEQGHSCQVRVAGVAPVRTDTTTAGTPILPGDFVKSSVTSNYDGRACKATLSTNAPAATQHILGLSFNRVDISEGVAIVMMRPQES